MVKVVLGCDILRHLQKARAPDGSGALNSFDGGHLNFHQHAWVGQLGLDAGAHGQVLAAGPCNPDLVHEVAMADVVKPEGRRDDLGFVGAADLEQPVDLIDDFLGLSLDVFGQGLGRDASQKDKAIGFNDGVVNFGGFVTFDGHCGLQVECAVFNGRRNNFQCALAVRGGIRHVGLGDVRAKGPAAPAPQCQVCVSA
jgi:hypothetical protein